MIRPLVLALTLATPLAAQETLRPVVSEIVAENAASQRQFVGTVQAATETTLAFQTLGTLAERRVEAGDSAAEGELLARLDRVTLADDVASAEAALAAARVQETTAAAALTRAQDLVERGVAPQSRLEAAQQAEATARAEAERAEADLAHATDALRFIDLTAPMDGVVISVLAEPGAVVAAGQPILTLAAAGDREAVFDAPEAELAQLKPGDAFIVQQRGSDAALPPVAATLRLIEPVVDAATRSRRLRLTLTDPPPGFRLGALVQISPAAATAPLLTLPASAVVTEGEAYVWRITQTRSLERRPITLAGALPDGRLIVATGIAPGDEILTRGTSSVTEGQIVGPAEGAPSP
jgi:RND family efflux transporter MFP subunit